MEKCGLMLLDRRYLLAVSSCSSIRFSVEIQSSLISSSVVLVG